MPIVTRILLDEGHIDEGQLQAAVEHQVLYGGRLENILLDLGLVEEGAVAAALSKQYGVPTTDPLKVHPSLSLIATVGLDKINRYKILPFKKHSMTLHLLMVDPSDHVAKAEVTYATGFMVKPYVAPEATMVRLLEKHCGIRPDWYYEQSFADYFKGRIPDKESGEAKGKEEARRPALRREEALLRLKEAAGRDEVVETIIGYARSFFRRVVFFIVKRNIVVGWDGSAPGMDRVLIRSIFLSLENPSIFKDLAENPAPFLGRIPKGAANDLIRVTIDKKSGTSFFYPVGLEGRVVNIIYGDDGPRKNVSKELGNFVIFADRIPETYMRIIKNRLDETVKGRGG